jgi:hypothetical protein
LAGVDETLKVEVGLEAAFELAKELVAAVSDDGARIILLSTAVVDGSAAATGVSVCTGSAVVICASGVEVSEGAADCEIGVPAN